MCTEEVKLFAEQWRGVAFVYVRQCSRPQGFNSNEPLLGQYTLRERAVALGWDLSIIHTIHSHFDPSDPELKRHDGFQQLLSEVSLGRAGIVLARERSCFTRQPLQWQQLIETCARTGTRISLDSGLYDPADVNDRHRLNEPLSAGQRRAIQVLVKRLSQVRDAD